MMNILDEIFAYKREEVAARQRVISLGQVRSDAEQTAPPLDFIAGLHASDHRPALIAEVKRASPSRGVLVENFDPLGLAAIYQQNGASAISVLTDERYFQGHLDYLRSIARLTPRLPLLRKDFICDAYQVFEARAAGADCVLLIAAYLEAGELRDLHTLARELGMAALVEVHSREELETALTCSPRLVGINNRDLRDFTVRLETTLLLRPFVPDGVTLVSESGIHTSADAQRLADEGIDAVLVGEALVTAPDVAAKVRSLVQ
jgi:indole-3-glycerol phosphate synthase